MIMKRLLLILLCLPMIGFGQQTGCISGDCENGYGTYVWENGSKYKGEWRNGEMHGLGTLTWTTGGVYKGEWKDGVRFGAGAYYYADGNIYIGGWNDNKRHFWGGIKYESNGNIRFGMYNSGVLNGAGWLVGKGGTNQIEMWDRGEMDAWFDAKYIDWNEN